MVPITVACSVSVSNGIYQIFRFILYVMSSLNSFVLNVVGLILK
jgi:hypothetical protein